MTPPVNKLYKNIVQRLTSLYPVEEAGAMTDRLFEYYFGLSPIQRIITGPALQDEHKTTEIEEAVNQLLNHVPLQYVIGKAFFMDMEFVVNPSVLIPRPETEELVSLILKACLQRNSAHKLRVLDIGTGSGCIAVSLKHYIAESEVNAIDISEEAIKVAAANASGNNVEVNFIVADILDQTQWEIFPEYDLIVSNPPYVTLSEKLLMQPNVLDYEPHTALFVPDSNPLIFYRRIIDFSQTHLSKRGILWFEINEMFGNELRDMALGKGFRKANIIFDFHGKSRFLQCFN